MEKFSIKYLKSLPYVGILRNTNNKLVNEFNFNHHVTVGEVLSVTGRAVIMFLQGYVEF